MKNITFTTLLATLLIELGLSSLLGQSYSIDRFAIAGGGGASTGGNFSLNGTIGQPEAGTMSGGNYSLAGGFWDGGLFCDWRARIAPGVSEHAAVLPWRNRRQSRRAD